MPETVTQPAGFKKTKKTAAEAPKTVSAPAQPAAAAATPPSATSPVAAAAATATLISTISERTVLCSILQDGREVLSNQIAGILRAEDFGEEVHASLFRLWRNLSEAGAACDLAALIDASRTHNVFTGGEDYLVNLGTNASLLTASTEAIEAAVTRIKELSVIRTLVQASRLITDRATSGRVNVESLTMMLEDAAANARSSTTTSRAGPEHVSSFLSVLLEQIGARLDGKEVEVAVSTGFPHLDNLLEGGFTDEDLIVLAARPSMGKTALMLNLLLHAVSLGRAALLFSMEMRGVAMAKRAVSRTARVPGSVFNSMDQLTNRFDDIFEAAQSLGNKQLFIDETPGLSLAEIRTRARLMAAQHPKMLIAVDYLQLIAASAAAKPGIESRVVVGEASRGLKQLARELKCPVIALSQLSRGVEARANKRPMMSDLRESGQIEQDADVIMFMYRDEVYNPETTDAGVTELIVAKQREGATGTVKLMHQLSSSLYEDHTF